MITVEIALRAPHRQPTSPSRSTSNLPYQLAINNLAAELGSLFRRVHWFSYLGRRCQDQHVSGTRTDMLSNNGLDSGQFGDLLELIEQRFDGLGHGNSCGPTHVLESSNSQFATSSWTRWDCST